MVQVKTLRCSVCGSSLSGSFGVSAVCSGSAGKSHQATIMAWSAPTVDHTHVDYDIMAWDVSDAIAHASLEHGIDLGINAVKLNLPTFIEACLATQAELDKEEK